MFLAHYGWWAHRPTSTVEQIALLTWAAGLSRSKGVAAVCTSDCAMYISSSSEDAASTYMQYSRTTGLLSNYLLVVLLVASQKQCILAK